MSAQTREIDEVLGDLDAELVALAPVKTRIREIAALLVVDRLRREAGLTAQAPSLHMSFTGNPGTGKTTVALRMAEILRRLGYVREGPPGCRHPRGPRGPVRRAHGPQDQGRAQARLRRRAVHRRGLLPAPPENERDYGQEAIEILLQVMENDRDRLVVILAGYKDRIDAFFQSNPGMASRVAHHIDFPDYTPDELMQIARRILERDAYRLSPAASRRSASTSIAACACPASPTGAAPATRSTAPGCATPAAWSAAIRRRGATS
jgi:hypothetical protein